MYNAELKESFLGNIANENSYRAYIRIFNSVENMEVMFNKDICEMSVNDILTVLDLKTGTRSKTIIQTISLLKSYVDWCIQTGRIIGENNFEKISYKEVDQVQAVFNKYLKDVEEFEEMCSVVYKRDAFYNETVEAQKELIIRLNFAEMDKNEVVSIKKDDVDFENHIIRSPLYQGIQYHVSDTVLKLCRYCIDQKEVECYPSEGGKARVERMNDNEYLIRSRMCALKKGRSENSTMNPGRVLRVAKEFFEKYYEATEIYKELTTKRIIESAMMIRIYNSDDPIEYINTVIRSEFKLKNPDIKPATLDNKINQVKSLYKTWVNAFF